VVLRRLEKTSNSLLFIDKKERPYDYLQILRYFPGEVVVESKCNSSGYFDDQEFVEEKKPGLKRVVCISDSMGCAATPCRYHAFTKAENLDGRFGDPKWEIYNMSICGINPDGYLYLLASEGLKYNADLYLMNFFVGNDLDVRDMGGRRAVNVRKWEEKEKISDKIRTLRLLKRIHKLYKSGYLFGDKGKRTKALEIIVQPFEELSKQQESVRKREIKIRGLRKKLFEDKAGSGIHSEEWWMSINNEVPFFPEDLYVEIEKDFFKFNQIKFDSGAYHGIRDIYRKAKELTNGKLAVILFPGAYQIDDELFEKLDGYRGLSRKDRNNVYNNIKRILGEEEIPIIDLLEPLKQGHKKYGRVYHAGEWHLNYWGNDIAARDIRKFLADYFEKKNKS